MWSLLMMSCALLSAPRSSVTLMPTPRIGTAIAFGVPKLASAQEQLEYATRSKLALRGAVGQKRDEARRVAVEAFRAVRHYFPADRELSAEAAFRAAELLRATGTIDETMSEFEQAWRLGSGTKFGARAGLEIGHLNRRRARLNDALASYEGVEGLGLDFAEERDQATYWCGRIHASLERPKDARRCYERAARQGVEPLQRIRAFDAWALALIDEGELEGAAGVLALCQTSLAEVAAEVSQLGTRVRDSLERMESPARLAREVKRRLERRGDAKSSSTGKSPPRQSLPICPS